MNIVNEVGKGMFVMFRNGTIVTSVACTSLVFCNTPQMKRLACKLFTCVGITYSCQCRESKIIPLLKYEHGQKGLRSTSTNCKAIRDTISALRQSPIQVLSS